MISSHSQTKSPRSERLHAAFIELLKLRPRISSELTVLSLTVSLNWKDLWIGEEKKKKKKQDKKKLVYRNHVSFPESHCISNTNTQRSKMQFASEYRLRGRLQTETTAKILCISFGLDFFSKLYMEKGKQFSLERFLFSIIF